MSIAFVPRDDVLEPVAVVGLGAIARALAVRLVEEPAEQLQQLRGISGAGLLAVLGDNARLPWVDGVIYLGRDPRAPQLLVPTALRPAIAWDVFERAILRHGSSLRSPVAIVASPRCIFSLADALPIQRAKLAAWIEAHA